MNNKLGYLIRYLRIKEGIKLEHLAKKLGISKSYLSQLETNKKKLSVDDLLSSIKYLGAEFKIMKNGEDIMKKMNNNKLFENGFNLTDSGYSKDYKDITGNDIRVEFCNLCTCTVVIAKDFKDTSRYLSSKQYNEYEITYSNNEGYGFFYEEYIEGFEYWDVILDYKQEEVIIEDLAFEVFDKDTVEVIKNDFLNIINNY